MKFKESWMWEFLALFISGLALAAIAAVIKHYNGKQIPTWYKMGIQVSLNSLISWMGQVARIGTGIAVSSGIAQLKWVRLAQKPRKVADIPAFDRGAGGAKGAAELIYHLRAKYG